ncbi:MAG: hypothetical protein M3367_15495 [Acidobacteriota bacterium]|nr:hypothetical protein [Acidobacteriota bacterium]
MAEKEFTEVVEKLTSSDYYNYVSGLNNFIIGKKVSSSSTGNSGFLLAFDDNSRTICFLQDGVLKWKFWQGSYSESDLLLLNNAEFGNEKYEVLDDLPYADEKCLIEEEIKKSYGLEINGLAIGERSFNLCFPNKIELDVMLFPDEKGKLTLRVFWEQW